MNNVKAGHKEKQSYANTRTTGKEQYYTSPDAVKDCLEQVLLHIDLENRKILEPAGGTGAFIDGFLKLGVFPDNIISYDIEPKHHLVKLGNYLETDFPEYKNLVAISNPPFGRASSLAKKFFNHAAEHCEYICFIVPKSWRKWTTHNSLNKNFHLIADVDMKKNCFELPEGQEPKKKDVLNTVFQIWQRRDYKRKEIVIPDHGLIKKIIPAMKKVKTFKKTKNTLYEKTKDGFREVEVPHYTQEEVSRPDHVKGANFQIIVFGHSCGKCQDLTQPRVDAKTTTMYLKIDRQDVKDALRQIDYSKYYNNVSYVQALSIQEINYELNEYFGLENFKF